MNTLICFSFGLTDTSSYSNPDPLPQDTTRFVALHEIMPSIRVANAVIYWLEYEYAKQHQIIINKTSAHQFTLMAMGECQLQKSMLIQTNTLKSTQITNQAGVISEQNKVIYLLATFAAATLGYSIYQTITK